MKKTLFFGTILILLSIFGCEIFTDKCPGFFKNAVFKNVGFNRGQFFKCLQ
jgi:hypothetical protein